MSIVLTCGQNSGCSRAHKTLIAAGLVEAMPSKQEKYCPADISRAICDAYKIDRTDPATVTQIEPGKVWQALSGDLMLGNLNQREWGWADPRSIYLLNYWRDYDPLFKFVLTYSSPEFAIAELLAKEPSSSEAVAQILAMWQAFNSELLRFYNANKDRAILVNRSAISKDTSRFIDLTRMRLDVDLTDPSRQSVDAKDTASPDLLASPLIDGALDAQSLCQELESAADMPEYAIQEQKTLAYQAWGQYRNHEVQSQDAAASFSKSKIVSDEQKQNIEMLQAEVARLRQQGDEHNQKQQSEAAELPVQIEQLSVERNEQKQENELLLLQLHQVQEELEHYFLKYQEATQSGSQTDDEEKEAIEAKKPDAVSAKDVVVDMRQFIDGDNWYYAEHDGRWAGPGKSSNLHLPALDEGRYRLELDIVDAIATEVIKNMKVSLDGKSLKIAGGKGQLGPWAPIFALFRKKLKYPLLLTSQIQIGAGDADKNHILEFSFPKTISPASQGSDDMRELAVRLRQVKLFRM